MKYSTRIDDYLNAIQDCDAFIVADREYGRIINYIVMRNDVFPDPASAPDKETAERWELRRHCRGLMFDYNGDVLSVPYHKFFNVGERLETLIENIDMTRPHVILEKIDGSMVRPIKLGDAYRMGTKMGITDVAMQSEVFVAEHPNYDKFIRFMISVDHTPIFEWCSRKQRIVIDYPKDRLVLTAIRNNKTGEYVNISQLKEVVKPCDIELVRMYEGNANNMEMLLAETAGLQGQEGWVIRFDFDMYKIKAEEYVLVHHAKADILREKGVIEMIIDEKADDVKAFLPQEDRDRLNDYETSFWQGINETSIKWEEANEHVHNWFGRDRKKFALEMANDMSQSLRGAIFRAWDETKFDWRQAVVDTIRKNISTQAKVDAIRDVWGGAIWIYGAEESTED